MGGERGWAGSGGASAKFAMGSAAPRSVMELTRGAAPAVLFVLHVLLAGPVSAQEAPVAPEGAELQSAEEAHPELAPMARLIGGDWYLGDDSYHTFSWGVGRESIVASSYWVTPEEERLVAQSTFFHHPGEGVVKGFAVARDMGIAVFEYEIRAQGDTLLMDLNAFGPAAMEGPMRETWVFTDVDHYVWTLWQDGEDGWEEVMGGTYERRRQQP